MVTKDFKLTAKSQITIPEKVKKVLKLSSGDSVYFKINAGHVEICPVEENKISIFELGKKYKTKPRKKVAVGDMEKAIQKGREESVLDNG